MKSETTVKRHPSSSPLIVRRWYVDTPRDVAKDRITLRHLSTGIESVRVEAEARAEMNDLKNGDLITDNLISPDVRIQY